jgi:hypothetical protein
MAKTSTTTSVWRSGGGDDTKTTYAGSMVMVADFYIDPTDDQDTPVTRSDTDPRTIVLPAGAVITEIQYDAAATGGTTPTFEMGWIGYDDPTVLDVDGLVDTQDAAGGKKVLNWATANVGNDVGVPMSATQRVVLTGGGTTGDKATGGSITGRVIYYVPTNGAYGS